MIRAITFDFGNTLVPVPDGALRGVVGETARAIATRLGPFDEDEVNRVWSEERARQFREEVPHGREVDLGQRLGRILARLRGMPAPPDECAGTTPPPAPQRRRGASTGGGRLLGARSSTGCHRPRRPAVSSPPRAAAVPARGPLQLAVGDDDRPLRRCRGLVAVPARRRRVAAGRDDQAPPADLRRSTREALGQPDPGDILHVGDDWAPMSSARSGPAGWRPTSGTGRPTRRPPAATVTRPSWPTWSWTISASWRRSSNASADASADGDPRRSRSVGRSGARRHATGSSTWRCWPRRSSPGSSSVSSSPAATCTRT